MANNRDGGHTIGPRLRLQGLRFADIPPYGTSIDGLRPFMLGLLQEAVEFMGSVDTFYANPTARPSPSGWKRKAVKKFHGISETGGPGEIAVDLIERIVPNGVLRAALYPPPAQASGDANAGNNVRPSWRRQAVTPETWACRRSYHRNNEADGTASWEEFRLHMKDRHVETEDAMTDTVTGAQTVAQWPAAALFPVCDLPGIGQGSGPWTDFTLAAVEMKHDLGQSLFSERVFPVLQMTCQSIDSVPTPEILVVSVPISDWENVGILQGNPPKLSDGSNIVVGSYVSVERFRLLPRETGAAPLSKVSTMEKVKGSLRRKSSAAAPAAGARSAIGVGGLSVAGEGRPSTAVESAQPAVGEGEQPAVNEAELSDSPQNRHIEWTMATASHARGILPLFVQTPVVPGKIAIDVPLFTKWLKRHREDEDRRAAQDLDNPLAGDQPVGSQAADGQLASNPQAE